MADSSVDGLLVQWGDRLFYPGNRRVAAPREPRLRSDSVAERAAAIRRRIAATVARRAPQVMVKVTGGGRGMKAIAAHLRYISKNGRLEVEDDRGDVSRGKETLRELAEDWRYGGSLIADESPRREAFNIILSMPSGTDAHIVQRAAREFARAEFADHKYAMVLHEHQASPHVHLCVRAESMDGKRLNPRKADLHRWREVFAEKLQGYGVDCEATRQATRGSWRAYPSLWQVKAGEEGRLRKQRASRKQGPATLRNRTLAGEAWQHIEETLSGSDSGADRQLARTVASWLQPGRRPVEIQPQRDRDRGNDGPQPAR